MSRSFNKATGLQLDAWGREKSITDFSLFHGVWTYDVPIARWKEYLSGVEQTSFVNATSIGGMLNIVDFTIMASTLFDL